MARVGEASTSQKLLKQMLKGHSDVGGDYSKAKYFTYQALELKNLKVFVGVVKGDTKLKVFHSMLKYNEIFATNNLSGIVIAFMGCRHLS